MPRTVERNARTRICHLNLAAGFRGGERQTQLLVEALASMGYAQRLVARRGGALAQRCSEVPDLQLRSVAPNPIAAAYAARGSKLLHAHEARVVYACWLLRRVAHVPYLLTRRVDNPFRSSPLRDAAYRSAARVVGVSGAIATVIDAQYGDGRCDVIPDAHANLAPGHVLPAPLRERYKGRTVIGHIGALDHRHKGQGTLIEVARMAAESRPNWHFVLAGDGRDETILRQSAAGLANVEFAGYVNNIADWLAVFDVFVFPSLHEGLGSTLLDAMSFGLPIVATRVGGIPDIVEDGVNGLLIAPEDPAALMQSIARIVDDSMLADKLRGAAIDRAVAYSPQRMAREYLKLYQSILDPRQRGAAHE